jgi:serine/threonine-protein kinase
MMDDDTTDADFLSPDQLRNLLPGFRLDAKPLSSTAMSRVYLASDTRLHDRKVVVKIMAAYLAELPGFRKRFLREIELMAELEHPHIMYIIAAARNQDRPLYFVMPRAETDLKARLADGALDPQETARVITQVASALDFAHDRGVFHRDVKPANVLFGTGGHVYLSDFGVAKHAAGEDLTRAGDSIGTRRYTAPEVYSASRAKDSEAKPDGPLDRFGDVYSLGAVLFHCLTGKRPFDEADDMTVAELHRKGVVPRIAEVRPDLPAAFDAIAAKAMSSEPELRYATCGELAEAFSKAVARSEAETVVGRDAGERAARVDRTGGDAAAGAGRGGDYRKAGGGRRSPGLAVAALVAGLLAGGALSYLAFGADAGTSAQGGVVEGSVDPTVEPVTGDDQAHRAPVVGECLTADEDYVVVACDSEAAAQRVYRIVTDPEDPNPEQPKHNDAAFEVCGSDASVEYDYRYSDSALREGREWNPDTDRIYYVICVQEP